MQIRTNIRTFQRITNEHPQVTPESPRGINYAVSLHFSQNQSEMARTKQVMREKTIDQQFRDALGMATPDSNCCDEYDCDCDEYVSKFKHNCGSCGSYGRFSEGDPEFGGAHWICRDCGATIESCDVDDTRDDPCEDSEDEDKDEDFQAIPVVDLTDRDCPPAPKKQAKESDFTKKKCCRKIDFDAVTLEYHDDNGLDDIEFRGSMLLAPEDDDCKIIGENWGAAVKRKRDVTLCIESNATIKTLFDTLKHYVVETDESNEIVDRVYALVNKNA